MWVYIATKPVYELAGGCVINTVPVGPLCTHTPPFHSSEHLLLDKLASFPGPSSPSRGLVHTACTCAKCSVIFYIKCFVHFLVRTPKIKNTELSWNESPESIYLAQPIQSFLGMRVQRQFILHNPAGIPLFRRGSIIFPNIQPYGKASNRFTKKGPLVAPEYLSPFGVA